MLMDYLDGQDLKSILRKGPLTITDTVAYLLQVCDALKEAHRKGIVHRDLKPANLFLTTRENETKCIKVLDFGIAKVAGEDESLTKDGMLGSLKYMSPEQLLKAKTADFRTDIWSLGMIAYEFLTTKTPFDGYGREDIVSHILTEPPAPFHLVRSDIPPALEAVILRCLHKDRENRFQSVVEVEWALCEAAGITPPVRATMASKSVSEGICLPPDAVVVPNDATQASLVVTKAPVSLTRGRLKLSMAAVGVVATTATVLTLVAALQEPEQSMLANAHTGVSAAFGNNPIVAPNGSVTIDEPRTMEMEQRTETKQSLIGVTTSKKASPAMTNKAQQENKTGVVVPDAAPSATTTIPEAKPIPLPKPPVPVQTATATTKSKWGTSPL
jgi:serine/threonine-protein kinase